MREITGGSVQFREIPRSSSSYISFIHAVRAVQFLPSMFIVQVIL